MNNMDSTPVNCLDFQSFESALEKLRRNDDKVSFRLNCEIPTKSFSSKKTDIQSICSQIESEFKKLQEQRYNIIERCLDENKVLYNNLSKKDTPDYELKPILNRIRLIKREKSVEEVIETQTQKMMSERCKKELYK
ncbi:Caffeine-induced death protein 2 family-containing protein [Strongyloides ratti]|uniref:Protein MIX23 n=1 Tax=Strongyloides ratti TaxID=34506 RepID=A0A090L9Q3_STRRB|nr:Caffeine-induced death protein 2 family-containing protein [Strongyloides ratti]CEF66482.1 Caffeine-induced death protein 2 family-containing protein [Strongyloides ratti]